MQAMVWYKLPKINCLSKHVHNFLKNYPQAVLACFDFFHVCLTLHFDFQDLWDHWITNSSVPDRVETFQWTAISVILCGRHVLCLSPGTLWSIIYNFLILLQTRKYWCILVFRIQKNVFENCKTQQIPTTSAITLDIVT